MKPGRHKNRRVSRWFLQAQERDMEVRRRGKKRGFFLLIKAREMGWRGVGLGSGRVHSFPEQSCGLLVCGCLALRKRCGGQGRIPLHRMAGVRSQSALYVLTRLMASPITPRCCLNRASPRRTSWPRRFTSIGCVSFCDRPKICCFGFTTNRKSINFPLSRERPRF